MKLSASKLKLASQCLYFTLDDVEWPEFESSPSAQIGTWYHAVCAWTIAKSCGLLPADAPMPAPPECMGDACELTPQQDAEALLSEYGLAMIRPEVSYVYSPVSGARMVGVDVKRDYGELARDEIPGTADVVILQKDRAIVVDWKPSPRNQDKASCHDQLAFLALCVHLYHGVDEVEVQIRFESEGSDGFVDKHVYDAFALVDVKDRLDSLIQSALDNPVPKPGFHCTDQYCPIRTTCPKTMEAAAEVLEPEVPLAVVARGARGIESAGQAGSLWSRALAAQALLDSVTSAVKAYVDEHGPVPLGDGKELASVEETRESLDADTIQDLWEPVQQWVSADEFAKLIKVSVPKGALEKEVKKSVGRGQKIPTWDAALDSLRQAGMIKSKTINVHRVRKVREST